MIWDYGSFVQVQVHVRMYMPARVQPHARLL